jgi:regulator of protease activity HflC (stomatin/prohibitin superfamily)
MATALVIVLTLVVAALVVLLAYQAVKIIPRARAGNVEGFGQYRRTLQAGLTVVVPFLDRVKAA